MRLKGKDIHLQQLLWKQVVQRTLLDVEHPGKARELRQTRNNIVEIAFLPRRECGNGKLVNADERLNDHPKVGVAL